ncbi:NAD-dependent epimerase/dehydratase family protein [Paenibacillus sp. FJAT-27812]|uniref:NAD-dependent epimerase/dehydratase family protein n=1 Tax=Paenibacillus sp. FJAT-27812 TaxID=1684143 RepID=UPI0006A7982D|nr:NAD-dependent epimerase/dehydratase family protein [Paenibacillus sp. FJAT-27812]
MPAKNYDTSTKISVILTGATGMVGEGVLHECLQHADVERVLIINRKPSGVTHPKLTEIVQADLFDLSLVESQLEGYNACFFCLGVSSVGMSEAEYSRITYDLTMYVAGLLSKLNPEMVFCYVTAGGTDRTEQGRSMWARVKGKTENHLLQLPFKSAYMFRPGYIHPTKGLKNAHRFYGAFTWLYPVLRRLIPRHVITLSELGRAMIHIVSRGYETSILESRDMAKVAQK